jgi:SOS-response transcriptional repressor LexA
MMPARATRTARFSVLQLELPGAGAVNAGVLLEDPASDRLYLRLRRDWDRIAPGEAEVLDSLETDLAAKAQELGGKRLSEYLCDTLSNVLRVTEPREVIVEDFDRALARLYREHVASTVQPFATHLPRYSLAVAAGKFLENQEVSEEGWEEAPASLRLDERMFVARIAGRSMEPRIADQSLCVFRAGVVGSREGRLVLVEALGRGENDRYTVKRYHSVKRGEPGGEWEHKSIRLEPLNPEFEAWDLDPDDSRYRIIAEFVAVLA